MVVLLTRHLKSTGEDRRRIKGVWISLLFPLFSADTPDVKRFAQVVLLKSLTLEGKCLRRRAKPAHLVRHLPGATAWCQCQLVFFAYEPGEQDSRVAFSLRISPLSAC